MGKLLILILLVTVFKCNGHLSTISGFLPTAQRHLQTSIGFGQSILGSVSQGFGLNFGFNKQPGHNNGQQQNTNRPQSQPMHVEEQSNENNYEHHHHQHQQQDPYRPHASGYGNQGQYGQGYGNNQNHNNYHHNQNTYDRPGRPHQFPQGNQNNNGNYGNSENYPEYNNMYPDHQHQGNYQGYNNNQFNQNYQGKPTNQRPGSYIQAGYGNHNQFNQPVQNNQNYPHTGEFNSGTHYPNGPNPSSSFNGDFMTEAPKEDIPVFIPNKPIEADKGTLNKKPETDDEDFDIDIRFKDETTK